MSCILNISVHLLIKTISIKYPAAVNRMITKLIEWVEVKSFSMD